MSDNPFSGFDIMVAVDVSASMNRKSTRRPEITRFKETEELAFAIALKVAEFDDDGIDVITFGQGAQLTSGVTPDKVADVFARGATHAATDTHEMIRAAAARQKTTGKNTIVVCFTDGDPTDKNATIKSIIAASNGIAADENLTFGFIQVGDDPAATAFLAALDDDLQGMGAKFDIVDAITAEQASRMDALEMLTKFVND